MRIHWFSPLPPAPTDIAGYTARVLAVLAARAEVVAWTDQDDWDPPPGVAVRRYRPDAVPWDGLNAADLNVYHLGNNHLFHAGIWQVSRRHAGLVILHEPALAELFLETFRHHLKDRDGYGRVMDRFYGHTGRELAGAYWEDRIPADYMARRFPLTPLAVEGALAVLTHNRAVFDDLASRGDLPAAFAPLPYPCRPRPARGPRPRDHRPRRLVMFGYLNANRRLEAVLDFLAAFPERDQFHLHVYGAHQDEASIARRVAELGLGRHVTRHGFVSEEQLEQALDDADLAINLRWPTMGEASGSQLRIWDHALPSLVTPVGWYATLPGDAVAFVRPDHEAEDLAAHLRTLLQDPERFAAMGRQGRARLGREHTVEGYVDVVLAAADEAARHAPLRQARALAGRAGRELGIWLCRSGEGLGQAAAERITRMLA